ncbi:TackOD1 domain-containing metal-binding protein [Rhodobium gokarnense]|uniref:CheY-like chemotaxis protein/ribosomal protein S27E n=1 Tax=Rhodobium gokarnense TaxID=364296 RepID=A0ABT3HFI4_9HYPH|nr:response regulator [Rhodobium gokarnense]MCW2309104.1 CheY-like chemotaxis protein/ribosomal protein S27E [Rhodobium gokarnense]
MKRQAGKPTGGDDRAEPARAVNVLIAEDSSITQDLLKLVLEQRGHRVTITGDGGAALKALLSGSYDVALLDFHLPEMNGLEVVSRFRDEAGDAPHPRFVAITADIEGLLAHQANCERFDAVVPKPVNIQDICKVVEDGAALPQSATAPDGAKAVQAPVAAVAPLPAEDDSSPIYGLGYNFLRWPDDFAAGRFAARSLQARGGGRDVDAVLVRAPATPADLAPLWQATGLHLLPVIDMAGTLAGKADLDCSKLARDRLDLVRDLIEGFHDRRAALHADLHHAEDPGEQLLGRMVVAGGPLMPFYDVGSPMLVGYNCTMDPVRLVGTARKLVERGLLSAAFFDRVHECASCGSSHFNVREECPECRSSNLADEAYLHHYRCAYQGPEADFRRGDALVCPKCRRELTSFGRDYDKPGTMVVCGSCGHTTSEPSVGFMCLSCGAHADGDAVRTRDIESFRFTDEASGFVEAGRAFLGFVQQTLRFAELPLELVVALNDEARRFNENGTPFALLDISYPAQREIEREHGPRRFAELRGQFLENLRHVLGAEARVVKGQAYDFALLRQTDPDAVRGDVEAIVSGAAEHLAVDPQAVVIVFGPGDLS